MKIYRSLVENYAEYPDLYDKNPIRLDIWRVFGTIKRQGKPAEAERKRIPSTDHYLLKGARNEV